MQYLSWSQNHLCELLQHRIRDRSGVENRFRWRDLKLIRGKPVISVQARDIMYYSTKVRNVLSKGNIFSLNNLANTVFTIMTRIVADKSSRVLRFRVVRRGRDLCIRLRGFRSLHCNLKYPMRSNIRRLPRSNGFLYRTSKSVALAITTPCSGWNKAAFWWSEQIARHVRICPSYRL